MSVIEGKVALITGGAGGIGLCMAKELLKNGLRAVVIVDISEAGGERAISEINTNFGEDRAIFIQADITDKNQFEEAFETTVKTYKQLDIVINNAGIGDEVQWEQTLALNLGAVIQGSYLAQQKYLPRYKSGDEGIIVNTASVLGLKSLQSTPIYCATKHGVVSLGQSLGGDEYYKRYKVRVLTICPGVVNTPILLGIQQGKVVLTNIIKDEFTELSPVREGPEYVGETLIKVLNEGKNGSLWVTECCNPPYEVRVPHWHTMKV